MILSPIRVLVMAGMSKEGEILLAISICCDLVVILPRPALALFFIAVTAFLFSSKSHSYQYGSAALNIGQPYMFCFSQTFPTDFLVTSFTVRCAAQGNAYFYTSPTSTVTNVPTETTTSGWWTLPPIVFGTHTIIGTHQFWTLGVPSGNLTSSDSLFFL